MKKVLLGISLGLTALSLNSVGHAQTARSSQAQTIAQNGSQAPEIRIMDLGISDSQLEQLRSLNMKLVMPKNVPPGFQLTNIYDRSANGFKGYLLVYRKGASCFGIEGTNGGIGTVSPGDASFVVKNAVLGRGKIEQQRANEPKLIGQWMAKGPFYRFVGANYNFNGGSELVGCQDITPKEAVFVSEALRYLDLEANVLAPTPVVDANSPTSTVLRYPTDAELKVFKRDLQAGVFGRSNSLSSAEISQRRAYQANWAKMNPTGARFAGAWVAGDRYYYVYPSKVKSRVCVVTLTDGKYEFSNGQGLSREMRYQKNSLFWIDQADVLAARDFGSGKLYPIYATQSVPDATEFSRFDFGFNRAECATQLPGQ